MGMYQISSIVNGEVYRFRGNKSLAAACLKRAKQNKDVQSLKIQGEEEVRVWNRTSGGQLRAGEVRKIKKPSQRLVGHLGETPVYLVRGKYFVPGEGTVPPAKVKDMVKVEQE